MKICECGSFAINDDPDGVLCDKCLLQAEIDKLRQALEECERQLAESNKQVSVAAIKEEARREVARDILNEINKYYVGGKHDYYHITIEDLIGIVKAKFKVERGVMLCR